MNNKIFLRPVIRQKTLQLLAFQLTLPLQKLSLIPYGKIEVLRAKSKDDPMQALKEIAEILTSFRIESLN